MKKRSILFALIILTSSTTMSIAQTYEYDNLNRLTKVTYEDGNIIEYTYDEYGNITKIIKKTKVDINQNPKDKDENSNNTDNKNDTPNNDGKTDDNNSNSSDTNNQDNSNQNSNNQNSKDKDSSSSGRGGGSTQTPKKSEEINQKEEDKNQENKDKKEQEQDYLQEKIKFKDIKQNTWYSESVNYVVNKKIMIGTSKDEFSPNKHTTRAMITTILYRLSGSEKPTYDNSFKDIKKDMWYTDSILWASQNNIVLLLIVVL